ncbi:hypothetical protein D3C87_1891840 [compost metagenome]
MTKVFLSKRFERDLEKIPEYLKGKALLWVRLVQDYGISEIQKRPGFHDEPLSGKRLGQRSVRLNRAYRLIYWVLEDRVKIELLEVNKHDY